MTMRTNETPGEIMSRLKRELANLEPVSRRETITNLLTPGALVPDRFYFQSEVRYQTRGRRFEYSGAVLRNDLSVSSTSIAFDVVRGVAGFRNIVGGSGYTSTPTVTIAPPSSPLESGHIQARAFAIVENGSVGRIIVVDAGLGYTSELEVTISGGGGSGATAAATLTEVDALSIFNEDDYVFIASAGESLVDGVEGGVNTEQMRITDASANPITVVRNVRGTGAASYTAGSRIYRRRGSRYSMYPVWNTENIVSWWPLTMYSRGREVANKDVEHDLVETAGEIYHFTNAWFRGDPTVPGTVSRQYNHFNVGGGLGAMAEAVLGDTEDTRDKVVLIRIPEGGNGSGYTSAPIIMITGGGGSGAMATAILGLSDSDSDKVVAVRVDASGSGYTSVPDVAIAPANATRALHSDDFQLGDSSGVAAFSIGFRVRVRN